MSADESVVVLDCRADPDADPLGPGDRARRGGAREAVGPRPGKAIDPLLGATDRAVVIGTDADLAAVALRLLRRDRLAAVTLAYLPTDVSHVARLWKLSGDPEARLDVAFQAPAQQSPLIRDDVGGVLLGLGEISPVDATVYVDAALVLRGRAAAVQVVPDPAQGVAVTVRHRRLLGLGHRSTTTLGRAVQFGLRPGARIVRDGEAYPRAIDRWTFYRHTEPMRVARPT